MLDNLHTFPEAAAIAAALRQLASEAPYVSYTTMVERLHRLADRLDPPRARRPFDALSYPGDR